MPADIQDVQQVAEELQQRFTEFKSTNEKKLAAVEAENAKLSEKLEKQNEQLSQLDQLKQDIEAELKAAKRPVGGNGQSQEVQAHKTAFMQFVRKGSDSDLSELEQKALQVSSDPDGGYAVPEELDRNVLTLLRDQSPMRSVCNQITVGSNEYKRLVDLGGAGAGWVGETAARPETSSPKLAQVTAFMGELYANPKATQTSLDDLFFNAESWLEQSLAQVFAENEGEAFLKGDGTNKPKGLLAYAIDSKTDKDRAFGTLQQIYSGEKDALTADQLIQLIYSLKRGYRTGASFMLNTETLFKVRTLKDAQGNYLWRAGLELGQPSTLIGYGVAENEDMDGVEEGKHAVLFGDFKQAYTIVDRMGTRILRDPYTNKPFVSFYTTKRVGGMLLDSQAVKVLTIGENPAP